MKVDSRHDVPLMIGMRDSSSSKPTNVYFNLHVTILEFLGSVSIPCAKMRWRWGVVGCVSAWACAVEEQFMEHEQFFKHQYRDKPTPSTAIISASRHKLQLVFEMPVGRWSKPTTVYLILHVRILESFKVSVWSLRASVFMPFFLRCEWSYFCFFPASLCHRWAGYGAPTMCSIYQAITIS